MKVREEFNKRLESVWDVADQIAWLLGKCDELEKKQIDKVLEEYWAREAERGKRVVIEALNDHAERLKRKERIL